DHFRDRRLFYFSGRRGLGWKTVAVAAPLEPSNTPDQSFQKATRFQSLRTSALNRQSPEVRRNRASRERIARFTAPPPSSASRANARHSWASVAGSPARENVGLGTAGGEGGIRTHERVTPLAVFKTAALNHSATSPAGFGGSHY